MVVEYNIMAVYMDMSYIFVTVKFLSHRPSFL